VAQQKGELSKLNRADRGFVFMMGPEITEKEEKTSFHYKLAKVVSFLNQEITFRLELKIKPKEKK
jgi:ABC-type enterochelin transport system ATPase subunit